MEYQKLERDMARAATELHKLERDMARAATELHRNADALVNALDGSPLLKADTAEGDNARAAYANGRAWRARVEGAR